MKYNALRAYPAIGERLLGNRFTLLQAINPALDNMQILDAHIPDVVHQVEYALNALNVPENEEDALQYLEYISGVLVVEFDHIEALLNSHPHLLTRRVVERVRERFQPIHLRLRHRLHRLESRIEPPRPAHPDLSWSCAEMLK